MGFTHSLQAMSPASVPVRAGKLSSGSPCMWSTLTPGGTTAIGLAQRPAHALDPPASSWAPGRTSKRLFSEHPDAVITKGAYIRSPGLAFPCTAQSLSLQRNQEDWLGGKGGSPRSPVSFPPQGVPSPSESCQYPGLAMTHKISSS